MLGRKMHLLPLAAFAVATAEESVMKLASSPALPMALIGLALVPMPAHGQVLTTAATTSIEGLEPAKIEAASQPVTEAAGNLPVELASAPVPSQSAELGRPDASADLSGERFRLIAADATPEPGPRTGLGTPFVGPQVSEDRYEPSATDEAQRLPRLVLQVPSEEGNLTVIERQFRRQQQVANRWENAFLAASAIDAAQTIYAIQNGLGTEMNPLMGSQPSAGRVIAVKAALGALQYVGFRVLNKRKPKTAKTLALISFGLQAAVVGANMRVMF